MLGVSLYAGIEQITFANEAVRVPGKVAEVRKSDHGSFAVISFVDQQGREHHFKSHVTASLQGLKLGEPVPVLFAPNLPGNVRIDTFMERWLASLIYGIVGIGLGGSLIWLLRKEAIRTAIA